MNRARTVRPTDLVALVSFDGRVYPNEARTWEHLGRDPEPPRVLGTAAEHWLSFATGRHTWISLEGQTIRGLISARPRAHSHRGAWEIDCLIAAAAGEMESVALSLFDQLSAGAARAGVLKIFLRVESGSDLIAPAHKAGFLTYTVEHLLRLDAPLEAEPLLSPKLTLRSCERADTFALFQLYSRVAPREVQAIEAMNLKEWQAAAERHRAGRRAANVVGERDGRIVAWLRTGRTDGAGRLDLMVHPEAWQETDALLAWGLRELGGCRPVFMSVPEYARPIAARAVAAGFAPAGEYVLLAKRLVQLVRAARPVRAAVKPVTSG